MPNCSCGQARKRGRAFVNALPKRAVTALRIAAAAIAGVSRAGAKPSKKKLNWSLPFAFLSRAPATQRQSWWMNAACWKVTLIVWWSSLRTGVAWSVPLKPSSRTEPLPSTT